MKKLILVLLTTSILLTAGFGCTKKRVTKDAMLQYMKDRYNEDFKCVYLGWESMIVSSEKFPNATIDVKVSSDGFSDNYTAYLMQPKIEEEILKIALTIYPKCKVIETGGGMTLLPNIVNPNMTVYEYSKALIVPLSYEIFIYDPNYRNNKDENLEKFRKALEEKKLRSDFQIFYMKEGKIESINDNNWDNLMNCPGAVNYSDLRGSFLLDDNYAFKYGNWKEINE